jgi:hypothetical protein
VGGAVTPAGASANSPGWYSSAHATTMGGGELVAAHEKRNTVVGMLRWAYRHLSSCRRPSLACPSRSSLRQCEIDLFIHFSSISAIISNILFLLIFLYLNARLFRSRYWPRRGNVEFALALGRLQYPPGNTRNQQRS